MTHSAREFKDGTRGVTIIELVVVLGFSVIVVMVAALIEDQLTRVAGFVNQELSNQQGLEQVFQEFQTNARSMGPSSIGAYPIEQATANNLVFYSDVDVDGVYERVRYTINSSTLEQGIIKPTGNPLVYATSSEKVRTLATGVLAASSSFSYFGSTYTGDIIQSEGAASGTVTYGTNVVQNADFESGTSPWTFYTNRQGSFVVAPPGSDGGSAAKVTLTRTGSNMQLYQAYLTLEPNTRYRLSFSAYSSTGHDMSVTVQKHGSPYTNYGLNAWVTNLGTGWQTYTTEFTTTGFTGQANDARLMFWFPGFASNGDVYYLDEVALERVIPAPENVVQNQGFESGASPWTFYTDRTGTFTLGTPSSEGANAGHVTLTQTGSTMQLYQANVALLSGIRYRLSFSAYSSTGHDMSVTVQKHGSPYTNYGLNAWVTNLGTGWQTYTTEFTTTGFYGTASDARLMFWFPGFASNGDVYHIDDVVLQHQNGLPPTPPPISNKEIRVVKFDLYADLQPSFAPQPTFYTTTVTIRNFRSGDTQQ